MNRRSFLSTGLIGTVAARGNPSGQPVVEQNAPETPKILNYQPGMKYRRWGNTDIYLSAISVGGLVSVESVVRGSIEQGVNLVHTCETYLGEQSMLTLGKVLKTKRDKVYIALKDVFRDFDSVLKILNTDYVDFLMFNRHKADAVADPKILEQFEGWKKQGKVRFAGLTSHGDVKAATGAGIRSGMFSFVMPALNQPSFESMQEELRLAQEKGIGVMAMKTMRGINDLDMQAAYLKKMLRNPAITTVVKGIPSFEMFDAFLKAMNEPMTAMEDKALYRHAQANRASNCMMCDECTHVCPLGVEVSTMLRCKDYYYEQMGDVRTALAAYRSIPAEKRGSAECRLCAKCEAACPNGIPVLQRLDAARELFARLA